MSDYILYFILLQLLLLVPSFYFYRWVFSKITPSWANTCSYICTVLLPVLFTWIFITINAECIYPWIRSEKFDSHQWKSERESRYKMVNDIIDSGILLGKTREKVVELLGQEEENGPCNNCMGYSTYDPDQGFSIDHEVLEIDFDKENKVVSVERNHW